MTYDKRYKKVPLFLKSYHNSDHQYNRGGISIILPENNNIFDIYYIIAYIPPLFKNLFKFDTIQYTSR